MAHSEHVQSRVRDYMRKAKRSLRAAEQVDLLESDSPTDRVCVDCQMCCEFSLKSFLLAMKKEYKRFGHNTVEVLESCAESDSSFRVLEENCEALYGYRGIIEYAFGEKAFPPIADAEECLYNARTVYDFVAAKLKGLGFLDG